MPSERRIRVGDLLVLVCHGSPGSQTDGLPVDLDPSVTIQRITRTDARAIACGHTHVAEIRDFGRRLIVNPGSCGYAFDGDAGAGWAMLTIDDDVLAADLMRTPYDPVPTADEISARGLAGDVYRAATVRTGNNWNAVRFRYLLYNNRVVASFSTNRTGIFDSSGVGRGSVSRRASCSV